MTSLLVKFSLRFDTLNVNADSSVWKFNDHFIMTKISFHILIKIIHYTIPTRSVITASYSQESNVMVCFARSPNENQVTYVENDPSTLPAGATSSYKSIFYSSRIFLCAHISATSFVVNYSVYK